MSMTEYERLQELLYRLREIMPEIGENPVADEMYNMVFEYAENTNENVVEVVRCKDCIHHRQLDRKDGTVKGWLTADDVFARIKKHWEENYGRG